MRGLYGGQNTTVPSPAAGHGSADAGGHGARPDPGRPDLSHDDESAQVGGPWHGDTRDSGGGEVVESRRYEALGRVMAALAGAAEMLEACRDLTWWRGSDHSWCIEWREGPTAAEVATLLAETAGSTDHPVAATATTASVDVMGVRFALRAIDPMGMARLHTRPGLWRLAETLHGSVEPAGRSSSRRYWEELLGG